MKNKIFLLSLLSCILLLQGCAAVVVGGAASTAKVSGDRRTLGTQWDDQAIELKAANLLADNKPLSTASKISVYSNNGRVLLVGQTPSDAYKAEAGKIVARVEGVRHVYNELRFGRPVSLGVRSNDSWITSKVKADMLGAKNFDSGKVKVVTENGEVFLIGLVTRPEGDRAVEIARHVSGVKRVIKAFEFAQN
ncbi:division/outer membrane stress-associated lipid-binding lipoprotein [Aeromonas cavernicola]|uniref:Osmotically-inducible protein OsmY n=1 Tax=Aeromonas cavernicola TaxID=1006623 RepID=A0A2H9U706_9GAMM|nr:division/outer membrane stress-associated lipid-binding lipoprotein [Aeromonas cavernicola]PJG59836.1 osmotically-inducible protein OsmY [Aeromonas cavernicola]